AKSAIASSDERATSPESTPVILSSTTLGVQTTVTGSSLDRHALGQVTGPVHIAATQDRDMVCQELKGYHGQEWRKEGRGRRYPQLMVDEVSQIIVAFGTDGDGPPATRPHLLHIRDQLRVDPIVRCDENDGHLLVYQRYRPML